MAASALPPLQLGQRPRCFLKPDLQCSPDLRAGHVGHRGVGGTGRLTEAAWGDTRWARHRLCSHPGCPTTQLRSYSPVVQESIPGGVPGAIWKVGQGGQGKGE